MKESPEQEIIGDLAVAEKPPTCDKSCGSKRCKAAIKMDTCPGMKVDNTCIATDVVLISDRTEANAWLQGHGSRRWLNAHGGRNHQRRFIG